MNPFKSGEKIRRPQQEDTISFVLADCKLKINFEQLKRVDIVIS